MKELAGILDLPLSRIVYVMTDFTWNNLKFWNDHESLRQYFECGLLDIAIFDAVNDESIRSEGLKSIHHELCANKHVDSNILGSSSLRTL